MDLIYLIGSWIIIVMIHEIGHGIGFYIAAKKWYKIYPKWYGFIVGKPEDMQELTNHQFMIGVSAGVIIGMIPLYIFFFMNENMMAVYLLMSIVDLISLYVLGFLFKKEFLYVKRKYLVDALKIGDKLYEIKVTG